MEYELYHHGTKGMKWGIRRYQNKDGSLTPAGRKRYANKGYSPEQIDALDKKGRQAAGSKKSAKDMTDEELQAAIRRAELEKRYNDLNPRKVSFGEKFVKDAVLPALTQGGKQLLTDALTKKGKKFLGLDKDDDDGIQALQKKVNKLNLEKQLRDLKADKSLKEKVDRLNLEKQLRDLTNPSSSKKSPNASDISEDDLAKMTDQELNDLFRRLSTQRSIAEKYINKS